MGRFGKLCENKLTMCPNEAHPSRSLCPLSCIQLTCSQHGQSMQFLWITAPVSWTLARMWNQSKENLNSFANITWWTETEGTYWRRQKSRNINLPTRYDILKMDLPASRSEDLCGTDVLVEFLISDKVTTPPVEMRFMYLMEDKEFWRVNEWQDLRGDFEFR